MLNKLDTAAITGSGPVNGSGLGGAEKKRLLARCHRHWQRISELEKRKLFAEIFEPEKYEDFIDLIASHLPDEIDDPVLKRLDKLRKEEDIRKLGKEAGLFKTKYLTEVRKLRDEGGATTTEIVLYLKQVRDYKITPKKLEKWLTAFDALQG